MMIRLEPERLPLSTRLPKEIKAWLENEALRNGASLNSEIIRNLRARMDTEPKKKRTG
jgi:predicted HicB family RNase H-like nuclease